MNEQPRIDRRKSVPMREIAMNVTSSIAVGLIASALGVYVSVQVMELKIDYLRRDLDGLLSLSKQVEKHENDLSVVKFVVEDTQRRLINIETKL